MVLDFTSDMCELTNAKSSLIGLWLTQSDEGHEGKAGDELEKPKVK